tara:strand:- start:663 stop:1235 length:573 start_codon:yes stop_codon:yes gene_type:complete
VKKQIPNTLTIFRIILVPIFIYVILSDMNFSYLLGLAIFIIAAITDALDGKLARKYNVESKFGMFMDPLADKMLVMGAFFAFLFIPILNNIVFIWMVALILLRDILVTLLRLFMKKKNLLMATSKIAKLKTTSQLISIILLLLALSINSKVSITLFAEYLFSIMIIITLFTVYTGIDYYYKNLKLMKSKN